MTTPFLPFTRPSLDEDTIQGVVEVLRSGWLATGPNVERFEAALSAYVGGRPVRVMTSATAGLEIALLAAGIGPGDEVITPAMSFVATANVILRVGAKPVFVDVDPVTRNIDLAQAERAITPATKALMPVHFAGLPIDMDWLYDIATRHRLRVIEDAAQAHGATDQGRAAGSLGAIGCFSFYPGKNLGACGEGAVAGDPHVAMLGPEVGRERERDVEPVRWQEARRTVGPFQQHDGVLRQVVEAELGELAGAEIGRAHV